MILDLSSPNWAFIFVQISSANQHLHRREPARFPPALLSWGEATQAFILVLTFAVNKWKCSFGGRRWRLPSCQKKISITFLPVCFPPDCRQGGIALCKLACFSTLLLNKKKQWGAWRRRRGRQINFTIVHCESAPANTHSVSKKFLSEQHTGLNELEISISHLIPWEKLK